MKFLVDVALPYEGDDCLIWPFFKCSRGYGYIKLNGKPMVASRYVCENTKGSPPDSGMHAAHSCGNGHLGCVNPNHLSWKTPAENMADKEIHGTIVRGERQGQAKLTQEQAMEIFLSKGKLSGPLVAKRFGVSTATVYYIRNKINWRHLHEGGSQCA